ncbi:MAG: LEPR-XLL domain-containing protein, partial [Planctomycetota bacterium]
MARSSKKIHKNQLRIETLESRLLLATDIVMYNDQLPGSLTHVNATGYSVGGSTSGPLMDFVSGSPTSAQLSVIESGVRLAGSSQFPAGNTDADLIFGGVIDFTAGTGASLEIEGNDFHQLNYSGLSPNRNYDFAGTAIRGNDGYTNRWSLVTINGADAFTAAHSSGEGIVTSGLNANQVAVWVGANHNPDQGFVARWTDIEPGSDVNFDIDTTQYTGAIPTRVNAGGVANGSKGYGLSASRLIEFGGLSVASSVPEDGAVVSGSTTSVRLNFTDEINGASLDATDVQVDGVPAVAVLPVNLDSAEWFFSGAFAPGMHTVELQGESVSATNGDLVEGYSSTFSVALPPAVENTSATGIGATLATVGANVTSTGFDDPSVEIYWGDNDGGTNSANWDNVLSLGVVGAGITEQTISNLIPSTTYHYRARATNVSGSTWADSTDSFTTTDASAPSIVTTPALNV